MKTANHLTESHLKESSRSLLRVQSAKAVTDGDGVNINRSVASRALHRFDPFLLLDEIVSDDAADYIGGFPEHPHRGFETVTYMLEGSMKHRDHMGNEGLLESGGVQWMSAGSGVLHSEMPQQVEGRFHGFQVWINLPAAEKMKAPVYREYSARQIPSIDFADNSQVTVIAGDLTLNNKTVSGPINDVSTNPDYFDISIQKNETLKLAIDKNKRVLLYVYEGSLIILSNEIEQQLDSQQLGELDSADNITIAASSDAKFLLLAAVPINEPVVNWGPFVMNTQQEIDQAISDYQTGNLVKNTKEK
ncbi:MAG: redox-sensitive bicupin YhaK (pirin superfamily) [Enterobacterales bacterium]|jgi:redox-sensitive bicupin YhaK (pirin superfamily)